MFRRIRSPQPSTSNGGSRPGSSGVDTRITLPRSRPSSGFKFLAGLAVVGGFVLPGCNGEVGSTPSSKEQVRSALESELEKSSKKVRGRPAPKSIKTKLLNVKEEGN